VPQAIAYSAKARRDIQREWQYLNKNARTAIADRFLSALERTSLLLAANHHLGVLCDFDAPGARLVRRLPIRLPFGRWLLFYEPVNTGIFIHRLAHGSRDLRGLL